MRQDIRFCTTRDGVRVAYATAGRGEPLMRVGGWLTHVERDWDSPVWRHWLEALSDDHTLARFDIRGSGLSDRAIDDLDLEAWVADLEAVADALGWDRFPLLGMCQGGAVALAYAVRHPERVSKLVLYNSYVQGAYTAGAAAGPTAQAEALGRMIEVGWGRSTTAFRNLFAALLMPDADDDQRGWWDELQRTTAAPDCAARLWTAFHHFDVRELAPQVQVPTLVCHVRGDAMVPFEEGRRLAGMIPGASFVPLDGKNHVLQPDEAAWPDFLEAMQRFLGARAARPAAFVDLTEREQAILHRIARGMSNAEIAAELAITAKTVRNHVSNVFSKLGVSSRAQAIVRARKAGFGDD